MSQLNILVTLNAATLVAILVYGYKVITFLNEIKFKTDLMWGDYQARTGHIHRRKTDEDDLNG